ncbi:MAG: hypothetical protein AB1560_13740 [Pseudomonadota bacterium]
MIHVRLGLVIVRLLKLYGVKTAFPVSSLLAVFATAGFWRYVPLGLRR